MKIPLPDSILGPNTFADFEAAPGSSGADLLVYVGGAVSPSEYHARRESSPTALLTLLRPDGARHSALALSYSPSLPGRPEAAWKAFLDHFHHEVLPALPIRPDRLAVIGFSLGAALAVLLARADGPRVVRLATVGAVGAAEAFLLEVPLLGPLNCSVRVAWNTEDPCSPHSLRFAGALEAAGVRHDVDTTPGGHAFPDYVANGRLPAAVAFAAEGLSTSC
jgi:pimeloyl-ACP methyl ester carboxylesterase